VSGALIFLNYSLDLIPPVVDLRKKFGSSLASFLPRFSNPTDPSWDLV
jgi:hypothetical protein